MTITLKIDNPYLEQQLREFIKEQKEITIEALSNFFNSFQGQDKLNYKKKDPKKYSKIIKREYNPKEADEVALLHIKIVQNIYMI